MCFSAIVSFSAAAGLSLIGIGTIRRTTSKQSVLLAAFPCLFALQQTLEGFVWLGKSYGTVSSLAKPTGGIDPIATYGFLIFASLFWLVLCPLSIYLIEQDLNRKKFLFGLMIGGLVLGIYLFSWIVDHGVNPRIFSGNLFYDLNFIPYYEVFKYLYLAVIVLPFSIAQSSYLRIFGGLVVVSFILSQIFFQVTMVSVWCFFAALLSGSLYFAIGDLDVDRVSII